MKKISVIGGGNMGFTYAESIYNSNLDASIQVLENQLKEFKKSMI